MRQKDFERFCEMNESLRKESTNALALLRACMIPIIVTVCHISIMRFLPALEAYV